jgi:hypothetical protein
MSVVVVVFILFTVLAVSPWINPYHTHFLTLIYELGYVFIASGCMFFGTLGAHFLSPFRFTIFRIIHRFVCNIQPNLRLLMRFRTFYSGISGMLDVHSSCVI